MNRLNSKSASSPCVDISGLGFTLYPERALSWRTRTIAGVSWNCRAGRAIFFNADGLALPVECARRQVPKLLADCATRVSLGCLEGRGQFALSEGEQESIRAGAALADWITYAFRLPERFANDKGWFGEHVAERLEIGRRHWHGENIRQQVAIELACQSGGVPSEVQVQAALQSQANAKLAAAGQRLWALYEEETAADVSIAAWLVGGAEWARPCVSQEVQS